MSHKVISFLENSGKFAQRTEYEIGGHDDIYHDGMVVDINPNGSGW